MMVVVLPLLQYMKGNFLVVTYMWCGSNYTASLIALTNACGVYEINLQATNTLKLLIENIENI